MLELRLGRDLPFQFGQRYLTEETSVWDHNAWDHVEWGEEQAAEAERLIAAQHEHPVAAEDAAAFHANPARYWDKFYRNNQANFFKDRKWLQVEFPLLFEMLQPEAGPRVVVEVGCGAGNTMFPVLAANANPELRVVGCDYSKTAVEVVRASEQYDETNGYACVWDLSEPNTMPETVEAGSVDVVVMVFVFSALSPAQWEAAVANVRRMLKPGGQVLFRDYGRYDLAQVRFKKARLLEENFYVRGDGTRVYFFTEEELQQIFGSAGFEVARIATDRRLLVNRKRQLKMYRIWMQGVFVRNA